MKREFDAKLWKTGNAFVVTIPAKIVKKFNLKQDDELVISVKKEDE